MKNQTKQTLKKQLYEILKYSDVGQTDAFYDEFIDLFNSTALERALGSVDEVEKWAYGNGITHKESFVSLVKFLKKIKQNLVKEFKS